MLGKIKSKIARWAVLRNKVEALRILVNDSGTYLIMSALRGPDTENENLKYIFTARIRCLAGMDCNGSSAYCRSKREISLGIVMEALKSVNTNDVHYLRHVWSALGELKVLGVLDATEYRVLCELADIMEKVAEGYFTRETAETLIKSLVKRFKHMFEGVIE